LEHIAKNPEWLEWIGPEKFIQAILSATDGEKDPRNLILAFDLLSFTCRTFSCDSLRPHLEEIFDRMECYFPISFSPPKDDKFKVKPEDLKSKLHACFASTPLVADLAIPFLLDKLGAP
jgi:hypothetical protein